MCLLLLLLMLMLMLDCDCDSVNYFNVMINYENYCARTELTQLIRIRHFQLRIWCNAKWVHSKRQIRIGYNLWVDLSFSIWCDNLLWRQFNGNEWGKVPEGLGKKLLSILSNYSFIFSCILIDPYSYNYNAKQKSICTEIWTFF